MTGINTAPTHDHRCNPDEDWIDSPDWAWPEPAFPDVEREDWEQGRCYNCGCWARSDPARLGEYKCENCGDIWDTNEPIPEIP
jgi:hypothetical protein